MSPENPENSRWFAEHVLPHGAAVRAWLQSQFPRSCDLDDIVQEAYVRVLHAHARSEIDSPKAFFFATARNLALGRMRRLKVSGEDSLAETDAQDVLDETADVAHAVEHSQELELLTQAIQALPTRCRQILTLRKIYGLSQRDVAARLGISEHTVEAQGTIALRKLAGFFERVERQRSSRRE